MALLSADPAKVKLKRVEKGWQQKHLVAAADLSASVISLIERGKPVSLVSLGKVARALGCESHHELLPGTPLPEQQDIEALIEKTVDEKIRARLDRALDAPEPLSDFDRWLADYPAIEIVAIRLLSDLSLSEGIALSRAAVGDTDDAISGRLRCNPHAVRSIMREAIRKIVTNAQALRTETS